MLADLRLALRALRRAPGFALAAVLCLALGVGANTAVYGAVRAVLLRPVATPRPDRLVVVREDWTRIKLLDAEIAPPEVFDLAARRDLFAATAGYVNRAFTLTEGSGSTRYKGVRTLGDFFGLFQVRPQLGRFYTPDDSRDGRHLVAVLTDAFWRERFGGDPGVVGRTLRSNDQTYAVVGVLPPEFRYPRSAQLFTPYRVDSTLSQMRGNLAVVALARLRDGVTLGQARAALTAEEEAWKARFPRNKYDEWGMTLKLRPFVEFDAGQLRPVLLVLLGAVVLVLCVACANLASLQLVRETARGREAAVRGALGAGPGRLARQPLAEGAVLAAVGGLAGVALGWALTRLFARLAPADLLALQTVRLDGTVLAATAAAAAAAALVAGSLPALRASRANVRDALSGGTRGSSAGPGQHRVLQGAVVAQVALSLLLLLGTGVLVRSLGRLLDQPLGFRAERVTTANIGLPFDRYQRPGALVAYFDAVTAALRATPGVQHVGLTDGLPLTGSGSSSPFRVVGRDTTGEPDAPHAFYRMVDAEYFRAMNIPLLRGRLFGPEDARAALPPNAGGTGELALVIDETLARRYFPGQDPIGQRIRQGMPGVVIGVVGAVRDKSLQDSLKATVYRDARLGWTGFYTVVVRSTLPDEAAARAIRRAAAAVDPLVPVYDVAAMPDVVRRSVGARRFGAAVLGGFAGLALLLAAVGIYGVLTYVVAQRTRELGIRAALGAGARDVARLVLRDGARLAAGGVALGALLFATGGRVLASQLYGVGPRDPVTILGGAALLGAVALLASYLPARRAARVDPAVALRAE